MAETVYLRPTWERWRRLSAAPTSLTRALMYERLGSVRLTGVVLDVGGGRQADYVSLLDPVRLVSVNRYADLDPSVIADANGRLPFPDDTFDVAISLNTFEHLRRGDATAAEMVRLVRPGGELHLLVPFLYRVHGHPDDYVRRTPSGWRALFEDAGVPGSHVQVDALVWDPVSTAFDIADTAPLGRWWWRGRRHLRRLVMARTLLFGRIDKRQATHEDDVVAGFALAHYVRVRIPATGRPAGGYNRDNRRESRK
jgi:SAM-dependent methyltransferase